MLTRKPFPYTPILGWSSSRYDAFSICKRRYFYQYYGRHDVDYPIGTIDKYKTLVSVPLEIGAVVHEVIQAILSRLRSSRDPIDETKLFDFASRATDHHVSTRRFAEVAYGETDVVRSTDLYAKVRGSLGNFISSERLHWLRTEASESSPAWEIDPPGYGETRLGDLKLYCKVDFLVPFGGMLYIFDWKTGQADPDKHRAQMIGYASWASFHYDTPPETVVPAISYLFPAYPEVRETFNVYDLESFAIQVRAQSLEMYESCSGIEQNIPLEKADFHLVEGHRICAFCNFRGLCHADLYPSVL